MVLVGLLCLTAITVAVSRLNLGVFRIWTALLIAAGKATLVLYFFMRMKSAGKAVLYTFAIAIITLATFISWIFFDIPYRYR